MFIALWNVKQLRERRHYIHYMKHMNFVWCNTSRKLLLQNIKAPFEDIVFFRQTHILKISKWKSIEDLYVNNILIKYKRKGSKG